MTMFAGLNVGFKRSGWGRQECLAGSCRPPPVGDRGGAAGVCGPGLVFRVLFSARNEHTDARPAARVVRAAGLPSRRQAAQ